MAEHHLVIKMLSIELKEDKMRYHLDILTDIEQFLTASHMESEFRSLEDEVRASATGTELCLRVGSWLLSHKEIAGLKDLRFEFIDYCNYNRLYPKARKF